jgi:hypothetical protein
VRVVLTHDLADDARALVVAAVGTVAPVIHRVDDPAVHGLHPVAHVGKRTTDDDRHRVVDVAALHLQVDVDRLDAVGLNDRRLLSHVLPLLFGAIKSVWRVFRPVCSLQAGLLTSGRFAHFRPVQRPIFEAESGLK